MTTLTYVITLKPILKSLLKDNGYTISNETEDCFESAGYKFVFVDKID